MPRRPNLDRPTRVEIQLPESLHTKLTLLLFSELEGRVPFGSYSSFYTERTKEYLQHKRLDLHPYGLPEGFQVSGPPEVIDLLTSRLQRFGD